jgi:hypothetical protein
MMLLSHGHSRRGAWFQFHNARPGAVTKFHHSGGRPAPGASCSDVLQPEPIKETTIT